MATLFSYFLICNSCVLLKDERFTITKEDVHSQLRLDGYYFTSIESSNENFISTILLYKDGTVLFLGTQEENIEDLILNVNTYKLPKYNWGVYTVDDDRISFERWKPGFKPLKVHKYEGVIQNDSTIILTVKTLDDRTTVETYHFKQFSPKPDSTNVFIK